MAKDDTEENSKSDPIVIEADESMGTADLEAEIEAQIQATLKRQKTERDAKADVDATENAPAKPKSSKKDVKADAPKPPKSAKTTTDNETSDESESVTVKVNKTASEDKSPTIKQRPNLSAPEVKSEDAEEDKGETIMVKRSAKTIEPINSGVKPQTEEQSKAAEASEPEPSDPPSDNEVKDEEAVTVTVNKKPEVEASVQPEDDKKEDKEPAPAAATADSSTEAQETDSAKEAEAKPADSNETSRKLDAVTGDLKTKVATDAAAKSKAEAVEQTKIYDTKQYHLPIKAGHHRQKAMSPAVTALILIILGAVLAVVAIDAELLDPGFNLPFDLI